MTEISEIIDSERPPTHQCRPDGLTLAAIVEIKGANKHE